MTTASRFASVPFKRSQSLLRQLCRPCAKCNSRPSNSKCASSNCCLQSIHLSRLRFPKGVTLFSLNDLLEKEQVNWRSGNLTASWGPPKSSVTGPSILMPRCPFSWKCFKTIGNKSVNLPSRRVDASANLLPRFSPTCAGSQRTTGIPTLAMRFQPSSKRPTCPRWTSTGQKNAMWLGKSWEFVPC